MERIGFDGFEWEEVDIKYHTTRSEHGGIYLYITDALRQARILHSALESAGIKQGDMLQLFAQGSAIFMLKKSRVGAVRIGKHCPNCGARTVEENE